MGILNLDLDKIYLNDVDFDEIDPETIIHKSLLVWLNKYEKRKALKKDISKELMPTRWW